MIEPSQTAIDYIITCCPAAGSFAGPIGDVNRFLKRVALEIKTSEISEVFGGRYKEHVAYAIDMVASFPFTSPPAAIASVYLVTRFEFYFRILSGKLNADGTWISPEAQAAAQIALKDYRLRKPRVSSVALAYKIMKIDQSRNLAKHCTRMDSILYATPKIVYGSRKGGEKICNIGDRIEFGRNAAGHGYWGDISSEAEFYGLMTALVFYNQS